MLVRLSVCVPLDSVALWLQQMASNLLLYWLLEPPVDGGPELVKVV